MPNTINKPNKAEYNAYYEPYVSKVSFDNAIQGLEDELEALQSFWTRLNKADLHYAYAQNKWTLIEVIMHIIDTERIMLYRALRFSKDDATELPGFDQDDYVKHSNYNHYSIEMVMQEFDSCRRCTIDFFRNLTLTGLDKSGIANNNKITVKALAWVIAGHSIHHFQIIKERYLKSV